jgi:hypothetical protein
MPSFWPERRALRPPTERDLQDVELAVSAKQDGVNVRLEFDDGEILDFRRLIESRVGPRLIKTRLSTAFGRFRRSCAAGSIPSRTWWTLKSQGLRATAVTLPLLEKLTSDLDRASFDPQALRSNPTDPV